MIIASRPPAWIDGKFINPMLWSEPYVRRSLRIGRDALVRHRRPQREWLGHSGVTGSLLHGLRVVGAQHRYNPWLIRSGEDLVVGVLSSLETLETYSRLSCPSTKFIVGPNISNNPSEARRLYEANRVRVVLVPSEWVLHYYSRVVPQIQSKLRVWAAGTDSNYWKPSSTIRRGNQALIFIKKRDPGVVSRVVQAVKSAGLQYQTIEYGRYARSRYRKLLTESTVMVYVGASESQGLALQEAWSCDVPTAVVSTDDACSPTVETICQCARTRAPYLTPQQGFIWHLTYGPQALISALSTASFSPRVWVKENATIEIAASKYAFEVRRLQ